jgi:hypothetical protein
VRKSGLALITCPERTTVVHQTGSTGTKNSPSAKNLRCRERSGGCQRNQSRSFELQCNQEFGHHASVVPLVGVADNGAQRGAVGRPGGFPLLDQIAQSLFANHWKDDVAHHGVRLGQCGIGQFEQQILLAGDALEIIEQLAFDFALGAGPRCGGSSRSTGRPDRRS